MFLRPFSSLSKAILKVLRKQQKAFENTFRLQDHLEHHFLKLKIAPNVPGTEGHDASGLLAAGDPLKTDWAPGNLWSSLDPHGSCCRLGFTLL